MGKTASTCFLTRTNFVLSVPFLLYNLLIVVPVAAPNKNLGKSPESDRSNFYQYWQLRR